MVQAPDEITLPSPARDSRVQRRLQDHLSLLKRRQVTKAAAAGRVCIETTRIGKTQANFSAVPSGAHPLETPLVHPRVAGGAPSAQRQSSASARSQASRSKAQSG